MNTKYHIDQNVWNEISPKEHGRPKDFDPATRPAHIYAASKVEGERAAWNFVEEEKPQFVLNTVCPNFNMGEILDKGKLAPPLDSLKGLGWEPTSYGHVAELPAPVR